MTPRTARARKLLARAALTSGALLLLPGCRGAALSPDPGPAPATPALRADAADRPADEAGAPASLIPPVVGNCKLPVYDAAAVEETP